MIKKSSYNIKYDLNDESIVSDYIATPSHSDLLKHILNGVLNKGLKSHFAFGPYGTGKSFVSTILCNILSQGFSKDAIEKVIEKFQIVDTEISTLIRNTYTQEIEYIPVILNGFQGNLNDSLISSIRKSLRDNNIQIFSSRSHEIIRNIIRNWERNYHEAYIEFEFFLSQNEITKSEFFSLIEDSSSTILEKFAKLYSDVTSGATLPVYEGENFLDVIETTIKKLNEIGLGLILIYDEFGRFLQNVHLSEVNKLMGQLQDLSELANSSKNFTILLITHKPITYYFTFETSEREEFSRIEKRFTLSEIKNDTNTFYRMTSSFLTPFSRRELTTDDIVFQSKEISKYSLFSTFSNDTEIENIIIRGCYPLHPVTLYLLPRCSSIFGQNERTLFTFLMDDSEYGLTGHLRDSGSFLYADTLLDYFVTTNSFDDKDTNRELSAYKKIVELIPNLFEKSSVQDVERIFKFILLWNITNSNANFLVNIELISYALDIERSIVEKYLEKMISAKIIRFNMSKKFFEIIEASAVDVTKLINQKVQILLTQNTKINDVADRYNPHQYIYSKGFNSRYDITRFAQLFFRIDNDFVQSDEFCDIKVYIQSEKPIREEIGENDIFLQVNSDNQIFSKLLITIEAIDNLLADKALMLEYRNIDLDLNYEKAVVLDKLFPIYDSIFSKNTRIYLHHENIACDGVQRFESLIDRKMREIYCQSLVVHNDQINMFYISSVQMRSIIIVLNYLKKYKTTNLDSYFVGNKPEFLTYYTVINSDYQEIKNKLYEHIHQNARGDISSLFERICKWPYGVRPGIAAVILVASLIEIWNEIMFFNGESFIADLPSEQILDIAFKRSDCQYEYSKFSAEDIAKFDGIISIFGPVDDLVKDKSRSIQACNCLNSWQKKLPVIVQLNETLGMNDRYFNKLVLQTTQNPNEALKQIIMRYNIEEIQTIKNSIEQSFDIYQDSFNSKLKRDLNITSWLDWAKQQPDEVKRSNQLVKASLKHGENVIRMLARDVDHLELERWPIAMYQVLRNHIKNMYDQTNNSVETLDIVVNGRLVKVYDVELSKKATLLKNNLENLIAANKRYVSNTEIEKVIVELLKSILR